MIKLDQSYSINVDVSDPAYPGGKAIPASAGNRADGTPWRALLFNTLWGFLTAIIVEAWGEFTVDGVPDKVGQSDLLDALKQLMQEAVNPEIDARITQNSENIASNLALINSNSADINYLLQFVLGLVEEAPNDGRHYDRKSKTWVEASGGGGSVAGDAIKAFKFYSDATIMFTNAQTVIRRLRKYDIGVPYLSENHEIYHFDTDTKNQNQIQNISIGYTGDAPSLVGKDDSVGNIYFNTAVKEVAPYEMNGRSLYGRFSVSAQISAAATLNAMCEFWARLFEAENISVFRFGSQFDEIVLNVGGLSPKYHVPRTGGIAYHIPRDGSAPYSVQRNSGNTLIHNWQGGSESVDLDAAGVQIQNGIWMHIAAVSTQTTMSLFIDSKRVDISKHSQAAQPVSVEINEDEDEFNLDEFSFDGTAALSHDGFLAMNESRAPYAALNHGEPWAVLEVQDTTKVKTNLFETNEFLKTYQTDEFKAAVQAAIGG
jgi:hypothetical protein